MPTIDPTDAALLAAHGRAAWSLAIGLSSGAGDGELETSSLRLRLASVAGMLSPSDRAAILRNLGAPKDVAAPSSPHVSAHPGLSWLLASPCLPVTALALATQPTNAAASGRWDDTELAIAVAEKAARLVDPADALRAGFSSDAVIDLDAPLSELVTAVSVVQPSAAVEDVFGALWTSAAAAGVFSQLQLTLRAFLKLGCDPERMPSPLVRSEAWRTVRDAPSLLEPPTVIERDPTVIAAIRECFRPDTALCIQQGTAAFSYARDCISEVLAR
jgi:hypothetical protein